MNIYTRKKRWKFLLIILAIVIISASFFYTNRLVTRFAQEERKNVQLFADAVHRKAKLVKFTEHLFNQLQEQENERVEFLANVYENILDDNSSGELTFYMEIIQNNKTIPVIYTDAEGNILQSINIDALIDTNLFENKLLFEEFTAYDPIEVKISRYKKNYLYCCSSCYPIITYSVYSH